MKTFSILSGFSEIAPNYNALLCDAWGVLHNGVTLFPGVEEALVRFRQKHGPVLILTNAPRPSAIIPAQLDRLGLSREAYDGVVTSGDAVRAQVEKSVGQKIFRLGPDKDDPLYEGLSLDFVAIEQARIIICTGLIDDQRETPEDYREMLMEAARRKVKMICANPDIVVRWGDRLVYCAGALAQLYDELGGEVIHGGKPHTPIYDQAMARLKMLPAMQGSIIDKSRILAIGDSLATDIAGANAQSVDALYIFGGGGIHEGGHDIASLKNRLEKENVYAMAAMETLFW